MEEALATTGAFKKNTFKGTCRACGKNEHKGTYCWENWQIRINAPLSTRVPINILMVVEIILVQPAETATKRVTKRKHVSKRNEIRAIAILNRLKSC
jgi:hypothetical protein